VHNFIYTSACLIEFAPTEIILGSAAAACPARCLLN
jgi:hypothetical protein